MKKITYLWKANPRKGKVIIDGVEYKIDEKLLKIEKTYKILGIIFYVIYVLFITNYTGNSVSTVFIAAGLAIFAMWLVRYFILPKDINKYLHKIEKGE